MKPLSFCGMVRGCSAIVLALLLTSTSYAQPGGLQQGIPPANAGPGGVQNNNFGGNLLGGNNAGGAANADFDTLIDLIQSTVEPDSWEDNGTGEGSIAPFNINGVWVDARGSLKFSPAKTKALLASVSVRRPPSPREPSASEADPRQKSELRFVSLPRLEAEIARRQREKLPLEESMLTLAGLERVQYVITYPPTEENKVGDVVVAGPAGDWQIDEGGRLVNAESGRPVVRLDDLLSLWRREVAYRGKPLGCSIVPRQEALAKTQAYLAQTGAKPLAAGGRGDWLKGLRDSLGEQDVEFYHVEPNSRVARLLLLADYHMKLVGMGLAEGVPGVESYLDTVKLAADGTAPPMSILRWWFSLKESDILADQENNVFMLPDTCVQVLSENELLAARGQRVHTGQSDELNRRFAESFTKHYSTLADKYPLYAELERLFELSMTLEVIRSQGLVEQIGWTPTVFVDGRRMGLPAVKTPQAVETVINHRVIRRKHIIAGVSGGVWIDAGKRVNVQAESSGSLAELAERPDDAGINWWWD
ncbi:MAG: DUF1598 domain-containing protein [Lacipirellulaceae bacterium]